MVYLLEMVIFHGKLLNNQRVYIYTACICVNIYRSATDLPWVFGGWRPGLLTRQASEDGPGKHLENDGFLPWKSWNNLDFFLENHG